MRVRVCRQFFLMFVSVFAITVFAFGVPGAMAQQGKYRTGEISYLKRIIPYLYEFSEVGQDVSRNAVPLQSGDRSKCSNDFAAYRGVVEALRAKIGAVPPPTRLVPIHVESIEALTEYITALNLYSESCTEPDFSMRSRLVNEANEYIKTSDIKIKRVNEMIDEPAMTKAFAPRRNDVEDWCIMKWPDENMQQYCIETQNEARAELGELMRQYPKGTKQRAIINSCYNTWKDADSYNYKMVAFCAKRDLHEYETRNPYR